jgi:hypothetical protein
MGDGLTLPSGLRAVLVTPPVVPVTLGQGWRFDQGTVTSNVCISAKREEYQSATVDVTIGQFASVEEVVKHFKISQKAQADFAVFEASGSIAYALDQATRAELRHLLIRPGCS